MASADPLFTTEKTVRHSIVPLEEAFKIPASVKAAVPVPAGKVAVYVTTALETLVLAKATRADSETKAVCPALADVVLVPTAM
jgi:hypothetical protein